MPAAAPQPRLDRRAKPDNARGQVMALVARDAVEDVFPPESEGVTKARILEYYRYNAFGSVTVLPVYDRDDSSYSNVETDGTYADVTDGIPGSGSRSDWDLIENTPLDLSDNNTLMHNRRTGSGHAPAGEGYGRAGAFENRRVTPHLDWSADVSLEFGVAGPEGPGPTVGLPGGGRRVNPADAEEAEKEVKAKEAANPESDLEKAKRKQWYEARKEQAAVSPASPAKLGDPTAKCCLELFTIRDIHNKNDLANSAVTKGRKREGYEFKDKGGWKVVGIDFEVNATFLDKPPPCVCSCCEYRQYRKGRMFKNGITESDADSGVKMGEWQEDTDSAGAAYGHRDVDDPHGGYYDKDPNDLNAAAVKCNGTGCFYKANDSAGLRPERYAKTIKYEMHTWFLGVI